MLLELFLFFVFFKLFILFLDDDVFKLELKLVSLVLKEGILLKEFFIFLILFLGDKIKSFSETLLLGILFIFINLFCFKTPTYFK